MVIQIPKKLQRDEINFVLIEKSGKKPFQQGWQDKKIKWNSGELMVHISENGNYGVMGGGENNLIIIDFDNKQIQDELLPKLPETFTVKTGRGMLHLYYFSDKSDSFKIFSENMDTLADIQGIGKQVVGAGSIHPNGNKYEVIKDMDIAFLPYSEVEALLKPYDKKPKKEEKRPMPKFELEDDFISDLKSRLKMPEVLSSFGVDTSKNPTACPFHDSKGGKCLGFTDETAHCFHCDDSWNIFSLVKDLKKYDFKEALEYLASMASMTRQLEESRKRYAERKRREEQTDKQLVKDSFLSLVKGKKWGEATELIVEYIQENYYIYTTKDDNKSEMWVYEEGIYVPQGKSKIKEIMREILGEWYSSWFYNQVMSKLEPDTFIDVRDFFLNSNIEEVPVQNGILNIFSRELIEFNPEKIFFNKLPVTYIPGMTCPMIDKFLSDVLGKEEDKIVFYEWGGFCLLKEYRFEKAMMLVGDGRNGKDKSLELIKRLIGLENCCSVPLVCLIPDSFIISEFFGRMINIAGDIGNKDLKDTSQFKALTGRSLISAPRKFLNAITFQNSAKFTFACNELPMVYDTSKGFWDRWILLEYPYTFVSKDELEAAKDKTNLKLRDENIIEKITTPSEMSGLLNAFLDGFDRIVQNRGFSTTKGSEEIKDMWIKKSNSFMAFAMEKIDSEYDSYITKKDLRKKYTEYCKKHKITPKTDYVIKRTLEELFGSVEGFNTPVSGFTQRSWEGITWKS